MGYVGYFLTTYLGGVFTVKMFSMRAGTTYAVAKELTSHITDVTADERLSYLQGNKDVLLITGIIAAIAVIPVLMIREEKEDYTVFLNRNLHIDKATSSLLVSLSYLTIAVFMLFTPWVVRKLGNVGTICLTVIGSVPFMLIIANGDAFGKGMVPMVGMALFMRAGFANLGSPAESALSMSVIPNHLRPAYNSVVNFLAGIVSIISGNFTGKIQ